MTRRRKPKRRPSGPPPKKRPKITDPVVLDILEGRAPYPTTREEQVARFELLRPHGITGAELAHWCACSEPTIKRWKRPGGTVDKREVPGYRANPKPILPTARAHQPKQQGDPQDPSDDAGEDQPAEPQTPAQAAKAARGRSRAEFKARLGVGKRWQKQIVQVSEADLNDIFDVNAIRPDFDALRILKGIASATTTPRPLKVQALRIIATHETNKGRIPWESIRVDQIPPEVQHRLAGMLLHLVAWDELPEEVRGASAARRKVWRELGILPETDAAAEAAIEAVAQAKAELRAQLFPILPTPPRAPLQVSIAVEAGRAAVA